jgi:DNA-binding transcriptional LysR family regulator
MRIASPSLPELHAFVAAARLGSFHKAADTLCVTPGAVSRAVARIENDLGCALFSRHARGCSLTASGQKYLAEVAPALDALESAAMHTKEALVSLELKLSVTPTLASHWLIRRLPDFQQRHPQVRLLFSPYRAGNFPQLASQGATLCGGDGQWPTGLEAVYVVGRQIVPVCRPEALRGPQAIQQPQDLLHRPLLFHALHPHTWHHWFETLGCWPATGDGGLRLTPAASFDQVSQLLEAAVSGMGVALVQRCLVDDYLASGKLVVALPQMIENERGYYFCYPEVLRRAPAIVALREWLITQGAASTV